MSNRSINDVTFVNKKFIKLVCNLLILLVFNSGKQLYYASEASKETSLQAYSCAKLLEVPRQMLLGAWLRSAGTTI
jgi:hypothetical protein